MQLLRGYSLLQLIELCKKGEKKAQRALYELLCAKMMGVCMRYTTCREDAEDILQVGFTKVFNKIELYKNEGQPEAWIRRIMINTAIDFYRSTLSNLTVVDIDTAYHVATMPQIDNTKQILNYIQKLPNGARMVLNLYAIEGYNHREIAEMIGISEGTSKSQLSRARQLLHKLMQQDETATGTYYR